MVLFALVTPWRLAGAPTRISPLSVYATTEGVVRAPSLFSMTFGLPPSMTATQLLVVPKSMPMTLAMVLVPLLSAPVPAPVRQPARCYFAGRYRCVEPDDKDCNKRV